MVIVLGARGQVPHGSRELWLQGRLRLFLARLAKWGLGGAGGFGAGHTVWVVRVGKVALEDVPRAMTWRQERRACAGKNTSPVSLEDKELKAGKASLGGTSEVGQRDRHKCDSDVVPAQRALNLQKTVLRAAHSYAHAAH